MKFIDEVSITLKSGKGGAGAVSFRREKYVPRGGPDGGHGGRGGHVIFRINPHKKSLLDLYFKRHLAAGDGHPGSGQKKDGAYGNDLVIEVPPGTQLVRSDGSFVEISGEDLLLLQGGLGGKGNSYFATSTHQAPRHAQPGQDGQLEKFLLRLKLIADVGIIGFPNAGKSTLISRLSAARPKIADYPFTTLSPCLGVVRVGEWDSFIIADIPGIIPGAHLGKGLGIRFLRHIERTTCFVHLIDASPLSGRDIWQDYCDINAELKQYDEDLFTGIGGGVNPIPLSLRHQIVVINKADLLSLEQRLLLRKKFQDKGVTVELISAVSGEGIKLLSDHLANYVLGGSDDNLRSLERSHQDLEVQ